MVQKGVSLEKELEMAIERLDLKIEDCELKLGMYNPDDYLIDDYHEDNYKSDAERAHIEYLEGVAAELKDLEIEKSKKVGDLKKVRIKQQQKARVDRYQIDKESYMDGKLLNDLFDERILDNDAFNREEHAKQIADNYCDPNRKGSYNMVIFGNWGVGKTVFAKKVQRLIRENEFGKRIKIVDYNAADYASKIIGIANEKHVEQQWGNLISELLISFEKEHPIAASFKYKAAKINDKKWTYVRYVIIVFICVIVFLLIGLIKDNFVLIISRIGLSGSIIMLMAPIVKSLIQLSKPLVEEVKNAHLLPTYNDVLGTRKRASEDLKILLDAWVPQKDDKIIVFVDDCDRCSTEGLMEIVEAMHLFLKYEKLSFVFLIDEKVLSDTIAQYYEKKESVFLLEDFLQKYISRTITLTNQGCEKYIKELANEIEPEAEGKYCLKTEEYDYFISYIDKEQSLTPRTIKRLLNSIVLMKKIFMGKENVYKMVDFSELIAWFLFRYFYTDIYNKIKENFIKENRLLSLKELVHNKLVQDFNFGNLAIEEKLADVSVGALMVVERDMGVLLSQYCELPITGTTRC